MSRRRHRMARACIEALEERRLLAGAQEPTESSSPTDLISVGGLLYFIADDGIHGRELWRTDGSEPGTIRLTDVAPGAAHSFLEYDFSADRKLTASVGSTLYFLAGDSAGNLELWRSTGTVAGTQLVKDLSTLSSPQTLTAAVSIANASGTLFIGGQDLFKSDGTAAGTVLVKDLQTTETLTAVGSRVFFVSSDSAHGLELWVSNGTAGGTVMVEDINAGTAHSIPGSRKPMGTIAFKGLLYFSATPADNNNELWRSDGTAAGTFRVTDIGGATASGQPHNLISYGSNHLLFIAKKTALDSAFQLYKTDGTDAGTVELAPLSNWPIDGGFSEIGVVGTTIYYGAPDSVVGARLWRNDGTPGSSELVAGVESRSYPRRFATFNGNAYFVANTHEEGLEVYRTIGTTAQAKRITDIVQGVNAHSVGRPFFTVLGNQLFFRAVGAEPSEIGPQIGDELWKFVAGSDTPVLVKDINAQSEPFTEVTYDKKWFVKGGNGDDEIEVRREGDELIATRNGREARINVVTNGIESIVVNGFEGNDSILITASGFDAELYGYTGDDTITGGAGDDEIVGYDGDDVLIGGGGKDGISGGAGADRIAGGDGDDSILGGSENDRIDGGNGNDTIDGGDHDDAIQGEAGNDTILGREGSDAITGGDGNDNISGERGDDSMLDGGTGNDSISGGSGRDVIRGWTGHDTLDGGTGVDTVVGHAGDDRIIVRHFGDADRVAGGGDNDTAFIDGGGIDILDGVESALASEPTTPGLGAPVAVPGTERDTRFDFDIAMAGNGSYLVVAREADGAVRAVRYSAGGTQVGQKLLIAASGVEIEADADADGDAVIVYRRPTGIYFVRVSRIGAVSAPVHVAGGGGLNTPPAVSMDAGGGFFVAWTRNTESGDTAQVQAFNAAGVARAAAFIARQDDGFLGTIGTPEIAAKPDGSGAVLATLESGEGIYSTGVTFVSTTKALSVDFVGGIAPDIAVHPDGSAVVVYNEDRMGHGNAREFAQRYSAGGEEVGDEILIGRDMPVRGSTASVDTLPGGGFVVAFREVDEDLETLRVRQFNAVGAPTGEAMIAARGPAKSKLAADRVVGAIATDDAGRTIVAYQQPGETIFTRRVTTTPTPPIGGDASITLIKTDVMVIGSVAAETLRVRRVGEEIIASIGSLTRRFAASAVRTVSVNGRGGDDVIVNQTALQSTIVGGSGNDSIEGGTWHDHISGGDGDDTIVGNAGDDTIYGQAGADRLIGDDGIDKIWGDAGKDVLYGGDDRDRLDGGDDRDWLFGQLGDDELFGGAGDDYLNGREGSDSLWAGDGNDELVSDDDSIDYVNGEGGSDTSFADNATDLLRSIEVRR